MFIFRILSDLYLLYDVKYTIIIMFLQYFPERKSTHFVL